MSIGVYDLRCLQSNSSQHSRVVPGLDYRVLDGFLPAIAGQARFGSIRQPPLNAANRNVRHRGQARCQRPEAFEIANFDLEASSGEVSAAKLRAFVFMRLVGAGSQGVVLPVRYRGVGCCFTYIVS